MDEHMRWLAQVYGDRRWIVASDVLAGATSQVDMLQSFGATDVLVVAGSRGTGPVPDVDTVVLGLEADGLMESIHAFDDAMANAGGDVHAVLNRFDPQRGARVLAPLFTQLTRAFGRRVWGARPAAWRALEDKTVIDEVWRSSGVPVAPSAVVPSDATALRAAASALDAGAGTVWVADNRRGWHGGATGLRWVRSEEQASAAATFMAERADQVRVMPFLEGIPCSINGFVLPDVTLAFRPSEMVVLRRPGRSDLLYAGMATVWDPPAADRDEMRDHARRVGAHLRSSVGYRGAFSIDGVLTADGFRPTELNPRFSAALDMQGAAAEVPAGLIHYAVVEGVNISWDPTWLERHVVDRADDARQARCHIVAAVAVGERTIALRRADGGWHETEVAAADVTVQCGPSPVGTFVRIVPEMPTLVPGQSVAALTASVLTWADTRLGLGLGPTEPATDVRAILAL
ncbi:MAG TPA: hypothetical protein VFZ70_06795 [Euzebyales bacterium]